MKSTRFITLLAGAILLAVNVAHAGNEPVCRNCSSRSSVLSSDAGRTFNGSSTSRSNGRVFGIFNTRSRSDMRDSWNHTHPKWSAGRKATGAAYR
jgi:hypothetical protein